ncbi:MAG: sigma-54-dependent Fis family transcriptional regulator [Spirochaetales bacterium]|nr:sigma-54-dependent Fis family transcriptional regulator [Spirochaetales bacterium]
MIILLMTQGSSHNYKILIVDDKREMCISLSELLANENYTPCFTTNPLETLDIIKQEKIDLVIMDIKMPEIVGLDLLKMIKEQVPHIPIIMITGYPSLENAVRAMKYGATDFFTKPLNLKKLLEEIKRLFQISNHTIKCDALSETKKMLTITPVMTKIRETLEIAADTDAPVLLTGESGTGKELAAYLLHYSSRRKDRPFIKVNCAAIPDSLLESELFGHEKGAFTDAREMHRGKFELAHHGTIFLDEIGDMSSKTQAKILRVLQDHEFERVGGSKTIHSDIRIVAATNKDVHKLLSQKYFREDLYYRLAVISVQLPPLRERVDDIMFLAHHFRKYYNQLYQKNIQSISDKVELIFLKHNWPGNIRELKNCIERAVIFCRESSIRLEDLPAQYHQLQQNEKPLSTYQETISNFNRNIIMDALQKANGVKKKAAKLLNIDRKTLYHRMKTLGIE